MTDSTGHRDGYGDRRTAWAGICDGFRGLQDRATEYGYGQRLELLAERTRQGDRQLADWHALIGELAELAADEEYLAWRESPADREIWPSSLDPTLSGFACPDDLCSRRAGPSADSPPRCELLRRAMTDLGANGSGAGR